jgi:dephospho-CoA kinase
MKIIGITGGIGAGKSQVLHYISEHYNSRILKADEVAHLVKQPGQPCYDKLIALLGHEILTQDQKIDHGKMADRIFSDKQLLVQVNEIIHPAVKEFILQEIEKEKQSKRLSYFFIEAALLIEDHYETIVDEMWYIYASEEVRRERLISSRQYALEKIQSIFDKQLLEETFRDKCNIVIDNSGDFTITIEQIEHKLGEHQ